MRSPCRRRGMRSNAAAGRVVAISRDFYANRNRNENPDSVRFNTDQRRVYAAALMPKIGPREIEWIRSDYVDGEISKFVSGDNETTVTITRNNPRRCCGTSTDSSGYSSHSPPLSAGSYSHYASATSALTTKDSYGGMIHQSETVPRPVWPPVICHHIEDRDVDYKGTYTRRICNCSHNYSLPKSPRASTRELLLQLSRILDSVIKSDAVVTEEDILRDISRIISLKINSKSDGAIYESVYPSTWTSNDGNLSTSNYVNNMPLRTNPMNSKFYAGPRYLYGRNTAIQHFVPLTITKDGITRCKKNNGKVNWTENSGVALKSRKTFDLHIDSYRNRRYVKNNIKLLPFKLDGGFEQCSNSRSNLDSIKSKYSMHLEYGDSDSFRNEGTITLSSANWNRHLALKGSINDFDFTLDMTRAEYLSRTIARAKRKRRWCRLLIIFLGLIFFILCVIVVSLSVTRGRKMFGSI